MAIVIDRAGPADAAELLDFLKQIGGESDNLSFGAEGLPVSADAEAAYLAEIENSCDDVMLVARENGRIIGNASLNRLPRRMRHRGEASVAVRRECWNRGVGGRLLAELIRFARGNGFEYVELQVRSDNLPAIHLYEKFGFQRMYTCPAFFKIGDADVDFDFMRLCLKGVDPAAIG